MRLDKYLKTARILKRREAAKELALQKRIQLNGRTAKPSSEVEEGDVICMEFGNRLLEVRVLDTPKQASKEKALLMFEVLREEKKTMMRRLNETRVLRDPVHGYIHIDLQVIWKLLDAPEFQRLRRIHQLGALWRFTIPRNIPAFPTVWACMKSAGAF
ncbi:S4 domain-containing protein [Allobaculum sp. Allo2]|uniref:S4 domain-containing protein n=1 Tax=Allobaculum sp. Allo2 TaxID=2853432 RepID=UPI0034629CC5|nr:hypothetical protein KWG61_02250 [Allobaculum sp. Allo2]